MVGVHLLLRIQVLGVEEELQEVLVVLEVQVLLL
jgi:hypothetical protein